MKPSPLELDHYRLVCLHFEEIEDEKVRPKSEKYVDLSDAHISASVDIGEPLKKDKIPHFSIRLHVRAEPQEGKDFPYRIEVGLQGFFTVHLAKDEAEARSLAAVNGTSILYGVAREVVLSHTLRFSSGPVMIPSVHFLDLKKVGEADGTEAKTQPSPTAASKDGQVAKKPARSKKKAG